MKFSLLGQDLHETAMRAKHFFTQNYGATGFRCEVPVLADLPLTPTWQARLQNRYVLCVNVQPSPFTPTLYEFVTRCAQQNLPIKLWVAVAAGASKETFSSDLRRAREIGIGVVEFAVNGTPHEIHRAVPLSLFALKRTNMQSVPKVRREEIKTAEIAFLDGMPGQGCQTICQELESITRLFAEHAYISGWWKTPAGSAPIPDAFFRVDSWAGLLEEMEQRTDYKLLRTKVPGFSKQLILGARAFTNWRNTVSHKPSTLEQLKKRDQNLRSMFEVTTDLLLEWYGVAKPLRLL